MCGWEAASQIESASQQSLVLKALGRCKMPSHKQSMHLGTSDVMKDRGDIMLGLDVGLRMFHSHSTSHGSTIYITNGSLFLTLLVLSKQYLELLESCYK